MISGPAVHKPALHEHFCKKVDKFIGAPHDSNTIANAVMVERNNKSVHC